MEPLTHLLQHIGVGWVIREVMNHFGVGFGIVELLDVLEAPSILDL